MSNAVVGTVLAAVVAVAARRAGALTRDGAAAAFVVGTIVFATTGWRGALVLFAFFIPSALLSRLGRVRKSALSAIGKHGPRDAWQVVANGGVAAACALFAARNAPLAAAFAGAFAAAAGDTWGTEIGTLSRDRPREIVTLRPIEPGLSGGVTTLGTAASIAGSAVVGLVAALTGIAAFLPVLIGGAAGALFDSILGATLQSQRWCAHCRCACETSPHGCGQPTIVQRGLPWLENDAVNVAATVTGALVAALLALLPGLA